MSQKYLGESASAPETSVLRTGKSGLPSSPENPMTRVLIVNGDPAVRRDLAEFLNESRCEVVETESATEAIDLLGSRPFDVVFAPRPAEAAASGSHGSGDGESATPSPSNGNGNGNGHGNGHALQEWIASLPESFDLRSLQADVEREIVKRALAASSGVAAQAARKLGLSRSDLAYKLRRLGITREPR